MGFSSWNCAIKNTSIPAHPWANKPLRESEVILVLPNDVTVEGIYDGYGRIGACDIHTNVAKLLGILDDQYSDKNFVTVEKAVKIVKKYNYTGQLYRDLPTSKPCSYQGFFYPENYGVTKTRAENEIDENLEFLAKNKEALKEMTDGSKV